MQTSDIIIHVDENLDKGEKLELENKLRELEGVIAPRFNKEHMLLVSYNPEKVSSSDLLGTVTAKGYSAQLIGM